MRKKVVIDQLQTDRVLFQTSRPVEDLLGLGGLVWGAAIAALLLPYVTLAQCPELPWHHHIHGTNGGNAAAWPNLAINSSASVASK